MDKYITGAVIRSLREKRGLTQVQLAERLCVSDKAVSKWETGAGYPDITLLEPLAAALRVSVAELLSGLAVENANTSANMFKSRFYSCPVCGNTVHAMGEASISCHGITLPPLEAEPLDAQHVMRASYVEDEIFVQVEHAMDKLHHVVFLAAVSPGRVQIARLYPEGPAEARFIRTGVRDLYMFCNRDGLFKARLKEVLVNATDPAAATGEAAAGATGAPAGEVAAG